jgi:hypothetical protein
MLISVVFIVAMNVIWYTWIAVLSPRAFAGKDLPGAISLIMREDRELTAALVGTVNILLTSVLCLEYSIFTNLSKETTGNVATGLLILACTGLGMLFFFYSSVILNDNNIHTELGHISGGFMYASVTIFTLLSIRQYLVQGIAFCITVLRISLWVILTISSILFIISNWSTVLDKEDWRLTQQIMVASFFAFISSFIYEALPRRVHDAATFSSSQRRMSVMVRNASATARKGTVKRLELRRRNERA